MDVFKGTFIDQTYDVSGARPAGPGLYRYQIVGVLMTDRPLKVERSSETVIAGEVPGLGAIIDDAPRGHWRTFEGPGSSGLNADQVICRLDEIEPGPRHETEAEA